MQRRYCREHLFNKSAIRKYSSTSPTVTVIGELLDYAFFTYGKKLLQWGERRLNEGDRMKCCCSRLTSERGNNLQQYASPDVSSSMRAAPGSLYWWQAHASVLRHFFSFLFLFWKVGRYVKVEPVCAYAGSEAWPRWCDLTWTAVVTDVCLCPQSEHSKVDFWRLWIKMEYFLLCFSTLNLCPLGAPVSG